MADNVQWIDSNGKVVAKNCQTLDPKYTVHCTPSSAPTRYTLLFNATWAEKGKYVCKCETSGISMSTELTVKAPPVTLTGSCTVKDTGGKCNDTSRKGSDILQFKASVGCSYPSATATWKNDIGSPITISKFNGIFKDSACTGSNAGQKSGVSTFETTWSELDKPVKVTVEAANEVGGLFLEIPIHKPAEKEDTTAVVIGAVLGVLLFLIIIGLIIFLVIRAKKKKQRMAYV